MKKQGIVIFGAGGHGKVVLDILLESKIKILGFADDNPANKGKEINGFKVLGGWDEIRALMPEGIALGIGNNKIREIIYEKANSLGLKAITAVHPSAVISRSAKLSDGVVVMPGAVVNSSAKLETGAVINTCASVDHDCVIRKFSQIWPGACLAGTVTVGEYSYVGTGASVIQNITIGSNSIIGSGAAVINDIPDNAVAVGVPAKVIKENR